MRARISIATLLLTASTLFLGFIPGGPSNGPEDNDLVDFLSEYLSIKYKGHDLNEVLYVAIARQKMYHVQQGRLIGEYSISTSKAGPGTIANSFKTPTGLHTVKQKIGHDVPVGGIFHHREYSGVVFDAENAKDKKDLITTRILWLQGVERGHNQGAGNDTYARCIYIHGTHQEELIGTPASHGCIRMKNEEIARLFDLVNEGSYVVILNN